MIRVLVVDDSPTVREAIKALIATTDDIEVVAEASTGKEALAILSKNKVDVVTMDIVMPGGIDGFEATSLIMHHYPVPIIIITACYNPDEVQMSFRAVEAGAVAILQKPALNDLSANNELLNTIRLMSEVKVVRRKRFDQILAEKASQQLKPKLDDFSLIAIGASTGGPQVIQKILSSLPADYPLPILVVQHIASGFTEGMVRWLQSSSKLHIKIAEDGEALNPSTVYFPPDDRHIAVSSCQTIKVSDDRFENAVRPSVSYLFRSIARHCASKSVAIVLTGMGKDGSEGLKMIKDAGGFTIAQDEASSLIYGMPLECVKLGAVSMSASPDKIIEFLLELTKPKLEANLT